MSARRTPPEARPRPHVLAFAAGLAALLLSQGCGSSGHPSASSTAERYVTTRIGKEIHTAKLLIRRAAGADPDIFVYCRVAGAERSLCLGSVASPSSHEVVATQRWRVHMWPSGSVRSASRVDGRLVPAGPVAERLAARRAALLAKRHPKSAVARALRRPATLSLKGPKGPFLDPTYVCVVNERGKVLFQGVIRAPRVVRVRARHLRVNLGNSNATVHVNGKIFRIPASPYGLSISRDHVAYLPIGKRPCGR